jgi:MFS family permease
MNTFRQTSRLTGLILFFIAFLVYFFSAETSGSLWDCGEFILAAYKLEVVHPPGAPLYMLIGRMFTWVADLVSSNPTDIAFAVNLMSGLFGALTAVLVAWITMMFGKLALIGREAETTSADNVALMGAGLVAGLSTTFATSLWFSAVEGEVYAMSTFFTALTFWAATKWYFLPDNKQTDRWIILATYFAGLSIGVHLLSILTFPAIALLYYFKKNDGVSILGMLLSMVLGMISIGVVMKGIVAGIPTVWKNLELFVVNNLGMPVHSGLIPTMLLVFAILFGLFRYAHTKNKYNLQLLTMAATMVVLGFSTLGMVPIRANADTPINMNTPSDATRLLPYLNREQYGERPLVMGPLYHADPVSMNREDKYGLVDGKYVVTDEKFSYEYAKKDQILFPRAGHSDRKSLHETWRTYLNGGKKPRGRAGFGYNLSFLWNYQIKYMYGRYFMWNFVGRQNGEQGYFPWDVSDGNWKSGISVLDDKRLFDDSMMPESMKDAAENYYYFLPFLFGFLGFFFHLRSRPKDFMALFILFLITGIGIIFYSNQPPQEPRERDYVLAGSIFTFCIWIGMAVLALYSLLKEKASGFNFSGSAAIATALIITAPIIMGFQNWDDHSRRGHVATRDYASNFLNSCEPNAIIFTYGDNDTYPVWYAQEVEGIRRDVRVVNLSLIQVDWYIEKLRNKVNDSAPIKLNLSTETYRGGNNNQLFFYDLQTRTDKGPGLDRPKNLYNEFKFFNSGKNALKGRNNVVQHIATSKNYYIPIDRNRATASGLINPQDTTVLDRMDIRFNKNFITKDELAIMDIIASNIYDRPIYFAVTCKNEKLMGLNDYMEMQGLALKLVPFKNRGPMEQFYIYGSGRMNLDVAYDNIMNKWKYGNFATDEEYFVNRSYAAEIQAMKMVMIRTAQDLAENGDLKRSAEVSKKFFASFPHHNFPYDATVFPFIRTLLASGEKEEAAKHYKILADDTYERLTFIDNLEEKAFKSFEDEFRVSLRAADDILRTSDEFKDQPWMSELESQLAQYDLRNYRPKN